MAHDAEEFASNKFWRIGLYRDPGHAEAVSADARAAVPLDKWDLFGPRPAAKVTPKILGIHIKGVSARSMHGSPWYVP